MGKKRLDVALVERGRYKSRAAAQRAIRAGEVFVNGQLVDKPATPVPPDAEIEIKGRPKYVSQGGVKLERALREFDIEVQGRTCLDVGASTGGFTDCLLQHGARKVYAVDVGTGQLDWSLRNAPRVTVMEGINARYLRLEQIGEQVNLATVDVSFISLEQILPALKAIVKPGGTLVALVKPQFEAGREHVRRGGVVKDPHVHRAVLEGLSEFITRELKLSVVGATYSPVTGPAGNIEFFISMKNEPARSQRIDWEELVVRAHRELGPC